MIDFIKALGVLLAGLVLSAAVILVIVFLIALVIASPFILVILIYHLVNFFL